MGRLVTIDTWLNRYFEPNSKPSKIIIRRAVESKELSGAIIQGRVFIEDDALAQSRNLNKEEKTDDWLNNIH